jgi:hypothetical protein
VEAANVSAFSKHFYIQSKTETGRRAVGQEGRRRSRRAAEQESRRQRKRKRERE